MKRFVREVVVEGADHPVAVRPICVVVEVQAVRVAVAARSSQKRVICSRYRVDVVSRSTSFS